MRRVEFRCLTQQAKQQKKVSVIVVLARLGRTLMREKAGFLQFSGKAGIEHLTFLNPSRAA